MRLREPIPLIDLRAQYESIRDEIESAVNRALQSQEFIGGSEVEAFERDFAAYSQQRIGVGCGSGSDAILLSLMALGVGPGDEVICPAFSFIATATCIARLGARPVLADIEPAGFNLDPIAARQAAASCKQLRAIIAVDLFGRLANLDALLELGEELGVPVIEDAAQAVGAEDTEGRRAGSRSTFGCFSLYPTKNLGAYGDGGIITTGVPEYGEKLVRLRSHGLQEGPLSREIGINSRLDAIQAAVLRAKLPHLEDWTKARIQHAEQYDKGFLAAGAGVSSRASEPGDGLPLVRPVPADPGARHVYHHYVVRVLGHQREALSDHLASLGISTAAYYPFGLHQQTCFEYLGHKDGDFPETESLAQEALALPVYPEMKPEDIDRVVHAIVDFFS